MPRPPLDPDSVTIRVSMRLSKRQASYVDRMRGPLSRSTYIRSLIARAAAPDAASPGPAPGRRAPGPAPAPRGPQTGATHRHAYTETGDTRPYRRGRLTFSERRQVCTGCPAERWVR